MPAARHSSRDGIFMTLGSQVRLLQTGYGPGDRRTVFDLQPGN